MKKPLVSPLVLRSLEPVRQGPVRRLPREGVSATEAAQASGECKICRAPTKSRIGVSVVVGTVWIRLCRKCIKKFEVSAQFIRKLSEIGAENG